VTVRSVLVPAAALALGLAVGSAWQRSRTESRSEDIVSSEFALLQRHPEQPTCAQLAATTSGVLPVADGLIHWRYVAARHKLQRLVVTHNLETGYDEKDIDCPASAR